MSDVGTGNGLRVLSPGRSSDRWFWLDIAAISVGTMGLAVVGAYVVIIRLMEWLA